MQSDQLRAIRSKMPLIEQYLEENSTIMPIQILLIPLNQVRVRVQPDHLKVQQQLLDDETRALQVELTSLLDGVQEPEAKVTEMSALNHLMSTYVLHQTQQMELLYDQAVEATKNVELGNKELNQAIQRNSSSKTLIMPFLFVLTFSILFLDWYT